MQKNDYLFENFGVDTEENEPLRARLRARLNIGRGAGARGPEVGREPVLRAHVQDLVETYSTVFFSFFFFRSPIL